MIGFLDGAVAGRWIDGCYLDVGGVGYRLACSTTTLTALPLEGAHCRLWTYVHVRDDVLALYGFRTEAERSMFEGLVGVSGVGPKVALAVCSVLSPDEFRRALAAEDAGALSSVPGVGRKTAQRIVLELKGTLELSDLPALGGGDTPALARSALENLGYMPGEVRAALAQVAPEGDDSVEDLVKAALRVLA